MFCQAMCAFRTQTISRAPTASSLGLSSKFVECMSSVFFVGLMGCCRFANCFALRCLHVHSTVGLPHVVTALPHAAHALALALACAFGLYLQCLLMHLRFQACLSCPSFWISSAPCLHCSYHLLSFCVPGLTILSHEMTPTCCHCSNHESVPCR